MIKSLRILPAVYPIKNSNNLEFMSIEIFKADPSYMTLIDWGVDNGIDYFYKGVIQDLDTEGISVSVQADATPQGNYSFNIPDVKTLLIRALDKAISSVGNSSITAPVLGKHFKVQANYPREKAEAYSSSYHDYPDNQLHDIFQKSFKSMKIKSSEENSTSKFAKSHGWPRNKLKDATR